MRFNLQQYQEMESIDKTREKWIKMRDELD